MHGCIHKIIEKHDNLSFKVPKPFCFYNNPLDCLKEHKIKDNEAINMYCPCYTMDWCPLVPRNVNSLISSLYFPPLYNIGNLKFVCRIYMDRLFSRNPKLFFNENNFPLTMDRLIRLNLPLKKVAHDMGIVLSLINFEANLDGRDIEFILGSKSCDDCLEGSMQCFLLDFDKMSIHKFDLWLICRAFVENDPYFPRSGMEFWEDFVEGYLIIASTNGQLILGQEVLKAIIQHYQGISVFHFPNEGIFTNL
jgi:hypothetical protein